MPHQCVHCGKMYPDAAEELLKGCVCKSKFFYYIKKEVAERLLRKNQEEELEILEEKENEVEKKEIEDIIGKELNDKVLEIQGKINNLSVTDKVQIEKDVREIMGIKEGEEIPVVLDLESIRILKPGKYEIDVVNLFNQKRPLIYQLEKGKYIIDLASTIKNSSDKFKEFEEK